QASIHALRADRAVNVSGVSEQEAAAVTKALGAAMMDAMGGKPAAFLNRQAAPRLAPQRGNDRIEFQIIPVSQILGQDADDPPVILSPHGNQQMKTLPKQEHVDFIRHHVAGQLYIGDKEYVFVRSSWKGDAIQLANSTMGAVASAHPLGTECLDRAIRTLECCDDPF